MITKRKLTALAALTLVGATIQPVSMAQAANDWNDQCTKARLAFEQWETFAAGGVHTTYNWLLTSDPIPRPKLKKAVQVSVAEGIYCPIAYGDEEELNMKWDRVTSYTHGLAHVFKHNKKAITSIGFYVHGPSMKNSGDSWIVKDATCTDGKTRFTFDEQELDDPKFAHNNFGFSARFMAPRGVNKPVKCNIHLHWARPSNLVIRSAFGPKNDNHTYHFEPLDRTNNTSFDTKTAYTKGKPIKAGKYLLNTKGGKAGTLITSWNCKAQNKANKKTTNLPITKTRAGYEINLPSNSNITCTPKYRQAKPIEITRAMNVAPSPAGNLYQIAADIDANTQFAGEIKWLKDQKITTGWRLTKKWTETEKDQKTGKVTKTKHEAKVTEFRPMLNIERGAMAAFLYRLAGSPKVNVTKAPFKDIPKNHQFAKAITWMKNMNITGGWGDGTFRSNDPVNRNAMAAFLYRFSQKYPNKVSSDIIALPLPAENVHASFKDTNRDLFKRHIEWLAQTKISTGWPDKTFRPTTPIKRDAMAAFLYRLTHNRTK
ncbi:hypothetical protein BK816_07540 [Boudabousia tangfeifanii]|uniref:SLH domain-containing protein n=1 Tax=Boudabousia tangfeifanii TaxID=1912795 RepID=A0A1D9MLX2_9ACTO|nr:S-layer homology domain-containing protein [Boudabousia tangfeifanii]AOZ73163.1 hypothetical protein BK816_07540 [Boudabousia tangfeifanii]